MRVRWLLCAALWLAASGAAALELPAGARLAKDVVLDAASYSVPVAAFSDGAVPMLALDGSVRKQAWQMQGLSLTPLQAMAPLVKQLETLGYRDVFSCEAQTCGGFDFRFGVDVLPAPDMFVNLRDFLFTTLLSGPEGQPDSAVILLASAAQGILYLQMVEVTASTEFALDAKPLPGLVPAQPRHTPPDTAQTRAGGIDDLLTRGAFVLDGLDFGTGAVTLGEGPFEALKDLAAFLSENPGQRIALVGHTDSVGSLDGNIRISKQRAEAVRQRLIDGYGIPAAQMDAEGMGYLAPRASNLTQEGRDANRRVEAIVLSVD